MRWATDRIILKDKMSIFKIKGFKMLDSRYTKDYG